jgi:hypothetical protein
VPGYQIGPFDESSVAEIAAFLIESLRRNANGQGAPGGDDHPAHDRSGLSHGYRWLLGEDNPTRSEGIPAGEVIRDDQGRIVGMIGFHPVAFRLGDRRLLGLGAHNFFVDPSARMQGFILFRRYLNNPRADFCYSTTCSTNVGPLWSKCGAAHLPGSDAEFVLVLRYGPVLKEAAIRKGVPHPLAGALLLSGALVGLVIGPHRRRGPLKPKRCDDWERLAAVAEQNRDTARLSPERSVAILRHRYAAMAKNARSAGSLDGAYHFAVSSRGEGWFSVRETLRGRSGDLRSLCLFDAVWPRGSMEFSDILLAAIELAEPRCEFVSIRDHSAWGLRPGLLGLRRRTIASPEAFVFSPQRSGLPQSAELAQIADFPPAFGT